MRVGKSLFVVVWRLVGDWFNVGVVGGMVVWKLVVACTCCSGVICCRVCLETVESEFSNGGVGWCVGG